MTGRHTLYGQSLVRSANSMLSLSGMPLGDHWVKSWIKPPKKQTANGLANSFPLPSGLSSGENTTSNSTPQPQSAPAYEFEVHAWVRTEETDTIKIDLEKEEDLLDLSQFLYQKQKEDSKEALGEGAGGPLTDADIRGAVGGNDMIGFSNSAAKPMKSQSQLKEEEIEGQQGSDTPTSDETPKVEPVISASEEKTQVESSTSRSGETVPEVKEVASEEKEVVPEEREVIAEVDKEVEPIIDEKKDVDGDVKME